MPTKLDVNPNDMPFFLKLLSAIPGVEVEYDVECVPANKEEEEDECPFESCDAVDDELPDFEDDDEWYAVPAVESIIYSGPATTILWADGTKTTVKCADSQEYDRYAGFCAAVCKKLFGSTSAVKALIDAHDTEAIKLRREAEKARLEQEQREAELNKKVSRAMNAVPTLEQLRRAAYNRATDMVIDKLANDLAENILSLRKLEHVANTEKEQ